MTHRNPFTAFSVNASRNITTYPQQLFAAPAGGDIAALVDAAFTTRIPDPVQRAQAVQDFLRANGLPSTLAEPAELLHPAGQPVRPAVGDVHAVRHAEHDRFTIYNRKSEVISGGSGQALPPPFGQQNNNTQRGGSIATSATG